MVLLSKAAAAKGVDTWTFNVIGVLFPLIGWLYVIAVPEPSLIAASSCIPNAGAPSSTPGQCDATVSIIGTFDRSESGPTM